MAHTNRVFCDYLILGAGAAGLYAALHAAEYSSNVIVLSKMTLSECNSKYAQGGVATVASPSDSIEKHVQDTLEAGAGLAKTEVVREIVSQGRECINDLINMGVEFTRAEEMEKTANAAGAEWDLALEGGHSEPRVFHAADVTGEELMRVLREACEENPNISVYENRMGVDLISTRRHVDWQSENKVLGAYVLDRESGEISTYLSRHTLLATGGAGKVYLYTSNPDIATGDGIAMAFRAHAEIRNMEFFQFHPTCLYNPQAKRFLISEAVRGEGAELKLGQGGEYVPFMHKYHERGSLAPRDVVARAIDTELKRSGMPCVYLDATHQTEAFLKQRFPNIFETCSYYGINMAEEPIPVVPAAHYCCGGVATDAQGRTTVENLYALGETACTGLHGANRLASNSLLEALVTAKGSVRASQEEEQPQEFPVSLEKIPDWSSGDAVDSDEAIVISHNWDEIRRFMWDYVGIARTNKRLERAKNRIRLLRKEIETYYWDFIITADLLELRNIASVAEMIIDSAIARRETRGPHMNPDYPESKEAGHDSVLRRPTRAAVHLDTEAGEDAAF